MLKTLTPNNDGIKDMYKVMKDMGFYPHTSLEKYKKKFNELTDEDGLPIKGFYLNMVANSVPNDDLMKVYTDFKRTLYDEDLYRYPFFVNNGKPQHGTCDNIQQLKDFYKDEIKDRRHEFVFMILRINQKDCTSQGGYRPYKSGPYLGEYKQEMEECEYYADFKGPSDYQGYLLNFHIIPIP